ncbi:unnamed protein product [Gordionus sp. m RMFG-2023]
MTFFYFANCIALAYVPYFLTYKISGLSEYRGFWKCIQAGVAYILTQLIKMLIIATFLPSIEYSTSNKTEFDIKQEIIKCSIDIADFLGMYMIMSKISIKGEYKFLCTSIGWAQAELIMTRALPFWLGAKGIEFDWKYIQMSLESNINLLQAISIAMLIWLAMRNKDRVAVLSVIGALIMLSCYKQLIVE